MTEDEAHVSPGVGAWGLHELYRDLALVQPEVTAAVVAVCGGDRLEDFQAAEKDHKLGGLGAVLDAVLGAWSAASGVYVEDSAAVLHDLARLRSRREAQRLLDSEVDPIDQKRFQTGGALLDIPAEVPAVWGSGSEVLWAEGEPLLIVAPPGVGKTTLVGQVVAANIGVGHEVLAWPVAQRKRALYIAADRPRQIMRSLRRHFTPEDRDVLEERLVFWWGPPPSDLAQHPESLIRLCQQVEADTVIIDSLKDVVGAGLTDDAVGAGINRAWQLAVAEGIEVAALHHQRKGQGGAKPKTLEDVYGSTLITAGAGSVILLWGAAGDPLVELIHLKQPRDAIGPLTIEHDHDRGLSSVYRGFDALAFLRGRGHAGATSSDAAKAMFEKARPTDNEVTRARRKLNRLVDAGLATRSSDGRQQGSDGRVASAVYRAAGAALFDLGGTE